MLWSAQSDNKARGLDVIVWLYSIGCDIRWKNDNGHGIIHKSAQRGKSDVCRWAFDTLMMKTNRASKLIVHPTSSSIFTTTTTTATTINTAGRINSIHVDNLLSLVASDEEGHCPSELAEIEGFLELAKWLLHRECTIESFCDYEIDCIETNDDIHSKIPTALA